MNVNLCSPHSDFHVDDLKATANAKHLSWHFLANFVLCAMASIEGNTSMMFFIAWLKLVKKGTFLSCH